MDLLYQWVDNLYKGNGAGPIAIVKLQYYFDGNFSWRDNVYLVMLSGTEKVHNQATFAMTDLKQGFNSPNPFSKAVINAIKTVVPKGSHLIFAGHSLGGMVAQMVAADEGIKKDYDVSLTITFGSPLIYLHKQEGTVVRLREEGDAVPYLSVESYSRSQVLGKIAGGRLYDRYFITKNAFNGDSLLHNHTTAYTMKPWNISIKGKESLNGGERMVLGDQMWRFTAPTK